MHTKLFFFGTVIITIISTSIVLSQTVLYDSIPSFYQLYPRNKSDNDSAIVTIKGEINSLVTFDSVIVRVDTSNVLWIRKAQFLNYNGNHAEFLLKPKIYLDTVEFSFEIQFSINATVVSDTLIDSVVCGDVFLIEGQSNALAYDPASFLPYQIEWVRSFGTMTDKDGVDIDGNETTPLDTTWGLAQADLFYSHLSVGITGLRLGKLISETYGIPVCIINGASGGTETKKHLRNDSDHDDLDTIYGRLLYRAIKASVVDDVSALFWWQGEGNTGGITSATNYYNRFQLIRDAWREDYNGIGKIYTAQLHVGSGATSSGNGALGANLLRENQRILALGDVDTEIMSANDIGGFDTDLTHFTADGYDIIGDRIFGQIKRDFYTASDTTELNSPNIIQAYFTNTEKTELVLKFNNTANIIWQTDSTINGVTRYLKDYFYFHNSSSIDTSIIASVQPIGNLLKLLLSNPSSADSVTYLPNSYYNQTTMLYEGPWLKNSNGIPALSFYKFPIDSIFVIDTTAATKPTGLSAVAISTSQINLNWNASIDPESGISYYNIYRDNTLIGQSSVLFFNDLSLNPGTLHVYEVSAINGVGLESQKSLPDTATTLPTYITDRIRNIIPESIALYQNFPNPFNQSTLIKYKLPQPGVVTLSVFNCLGEKIRTLVNQYTSPGIYNINWNGRNDIGNLVGSGIYFYQLTLNGVQVFNLHKKMLMVK